MMERWAAQFGCTAVCLAGAGRACGQTALLDNALGFSGASLAEQRRIVAPEIAEAARSFRLEGLDVGRIRLTVSLQRAAPPAQPYPTLRYTVSDARRELFRSLGTHGPTRFALAGDIREGAARGLGFQMIRQAGDRGAFTDGRLAYSRGGLASSLRIRQADQSFGRSSVTTDEEWNAAKDVVGWRQTDFDLKWRGSGGLSLAGAFSRANAQSSDATRAHDRFDLAWTPNSRTGLTAYVDSSSQSTGGQRRSGGATGIAWKQSLGLASLSLAQDNARGLDGRSSVTRRLNLASADNVPVVWSVGLLDAANGGNRSSERRLALRTREGRRLWASVSHLAAANGGNRRRETSLALRSTPSKALRLEGAYDSGSARRATSLHTLWSPRRLTIDLNLRRADDPKLARRDDALRLEGLLAPRTRLVLSWAGVAPRDGLPGSFGALDFRHEGRTGVLAAGWRQAGGTLAGKGGSVLSFATAPGLAWKADLLWKRTTGRPETRVLGISRVIAGESRWEARYADHPEDAGGNPQPLKSILFGLHTAIARGLRLDTSAIMERRGADSLRRLDLGLRGRIGRLDLDAGVCALFQRGQRKLPSWRLSMAHEADRLHRFVVRLERVARTANPVTGQFEWVTDF